MSLALNFLPNDPHWQTVAAYILPDTVAEREIAILDDPPAEDRGQCPQNRAERYRD